MAIESQFIQVASSSTELASTWIYLVDWILVLVFGTLFIFYFGRLIGFVLSLIARVVLNRSKIRINVESVRFSILGGRFMIKNLTVMTENWTLSVLMFNLTWRYWLGGQTRICEYLVDHPGLESGSEDSGIKKAHNEKLPSRFLLKLEGLEVYMYNRTFAYDQIVELLNRETQQRNNNYTNEKETTSVSSESVSEHETQAAQAVKWLNRLLRWLPLSLIVKKGVMVLGNHMCPSLLVATFKQASGIMDIAHASNEFDVYKQFSLFELKELQVYLKPNIVYEAESRTRFPAIKNLFFRRHRSLMDEIQWGGLRRYVETGDDILDGISNTEEYAKYSLVLDAVTAKVNYYYDIPGDKVNASFPEYGCDMEVSMATVHYGAWADKQRVPLQTMFFPAVGRDTVPTELRTRQYHGFKLNVVTNDEIIVRVPTREPSKDKDALKHHTPLQNKRPFGWLELKLGANSSVRVFSSFVSLQKSGTENIVDAVFVQPEVRSSVNHDILYSADIHTINANVGFPLGLNEKCTWTFDNFSSNGRIFFLREHVLLLSDIFSDFASGPSPKYEYFRPFEYVVNWELVDYKLYMNINDSNVINNPLDFTSNKYLSFQGHELKVNIRIPIAGEFASSTTVEFNCNAPYFDLVLDVPPWYTTHSFLAPSYPLGRAYNCELDGSYTFLNKVEIFGAHNIVIRWKTDDVTLKLYGFLVKFVFVLRENYFGQRFHFKTFEEYNNEIDDMSSIDSTKEDFDYWNIIKTENNVDVMFSFQVRHGILIFPQDIYGCKAHIGLMFDYFDMDIRFTNFYMDMQADFSPVTGKYLKLETEDMILNDKSSYLDLLTQGDPHITIQDLTIHGHRMFGIPPEEITYYCNWRAATNAIAIDAPFPFIDNLGKCCSNFLASFQDLENALHATIPTIYDAFVITFDCTTIDIKLHCQDLVSELGLQAVLVTFNDLSNHRYTNKLSVKIDKIVHKVGDKHGNILGVLETALVIDNPSKQANFAYHCRAQQEHVRFNDAPFHRAPFLLFEENRNVNYKQGYGSFIVPISLVDVNYPLNEFTRLYNTFLNSSDSSISSQDSSKSGGMYFAPTTHYHDDDFLPETQNDETFKYDNMIHTFSPIRGYFSTEAIAAYATISNMLADSELDVVMDIFEKSVVKKLRLLMLTVCRVDTARIVVPIIEMGLGEGYVANNPEDLAIQSRIKLVIEEPSIAISTETKRVDLNADKDDNSNSLLDYETTILKTCAFSIKKVSVDIDSKCDLSIRDLEFWMSNDNQSIFSIDVDTIRLNIDRGNIVEVIKYVNSLVRQLESSIEMLQKLKHLKQKMQMALIYKLSKASKFIDHDPSVLTKPAYMIRSLNQHIRFFDTWLVMIRLRHIFHSMSQQWHQSQYETLKAQNWDIPGNAYDEVMDIFSHWRSWEANYQEREVFLQQMFNIKPLLEQKSICQILVNKFETNISNNDFITFENVSVSFNDRKINANFSKTNPEVNDFDAKLGSLEVSVNLSNYRSSLSHDTIKLIPQILRETKSTKPIIKAESTVEIPTNFGFFFIININEITQKFHLTHSTMKLTALGVNSTGIFQDIENVTLLTSTSGFSMIKLGIEDRGSMEMKNLKLVYGDACNSQLVNIVMESWEIQVLNSALWKSIQGIKQDLQLYELIKKQPSPDTNLLDKFNQMVLLNADLSIEVNNFSWVIDGFADYKIEGNIVDTNISFIMSDGSIDVGCLVQKSVISIHFKHVMILEAKNSQLFNNIRVSKVDGLPSVYVDSHFGYTQVFSPKLITSINKCLDSWERIRNEVDTILAAFIQTTPKKTTKKIDIWQVPMEFKVSNYYTGVSFLAHKAKFSLELEEMNVHMANLGNGKFNGALVLPTTRISVTDRDIPPGLSNVLDFNMSVKLTTDGKGKTLEAQSDYFRVCLSLGIVQRVILLADEMAVISHRVRGASAGASAGAGAGCGACTSSISVHFLFYNFSLGWIFDNGTTEYPGVIVGAERFYAVTDEGVGKLSLIEAYLSVAHGSDSSTFFATGSEKDVSNRAFLPFVQYIYMVNEVNGIKEMKAKITGDELDVKFLSDSFQLLELLMNAVSSVQAVFDSRVRPVDWKDPSKSDEQQQIDYINSLRSTFESIEVFTTFAGSNVLIHRLDSNTSPIFLHFPAVKIHFSYAHDKLGPKKHILRSQIFTSSSDNKLLSNCVPVVLDLVDSVRRAMKEPIRDTPVDKREKLNFSSLLRETDFYLGIKVDKQILALSCEPTAKVEAEIGIEGLNFQIMSGDECIEVLGNLELISISLRHIYSRQVSGYFKIESIWAMVAIQIGAISLKSCGLISNVDGYIDIKQYQDLALFRDIWVPDSVIRRRYDGTRSDQGDSLAANRNIASRSKEVSTTSAIPWILTYMLLDVKITVNFGPSLGEMVLAVERLWMVSQRSSDWTQELNLGIDRYILTSEGRLGGEIAGTDIYLQSGISWKIDDETLQVPLILMSAGIETLAVKGTFDYHLFVVVKLQQFSLDIFNRKFENMISKDHLFVTTRFQDFEVFMSSFTIANIYDIYLTIVRMTQENNISYKQTLRDSKGKHPPAKTISNNAILETVKKLETEFEVVLGSLGIYIYPSSFDDTKVLKIKLDESSAFFSQNEYNEGISNQLEVQFNDLTVSLSINSVVAEDFIITSTIDEFIGHAHRAVGGNIFLFPSFQISMKTFQKYRSSVVQYLYQSTFGGTVDIRWNLGTVNFIREMYSIHVKSLESRTEVKNTMERDIEFNQEIFMSHHRPIIDDISDPILESKDIDEALIGKFEKVSKESKYQYEPLAPPIIQAPQIKELGNATPPLEWFGLHRDKFPNVTHELAIVSLQRFIHEIETEYLRVLGKA